MAIPSYFENTHIVYHYTMDTIGIDKTMLDCFDETFIPKNRESSGISRENTFYWERKGNLNVLQKKWIEITFPVFANHFI